MRNLVQALLIVGCVGCAAEAHAQTNPARCEAVGGSIVTNFVEQTTTVGSVMGDLKGGVSASVLQVTPGSGGRITFRVVHRFVTESGDVLVSEPAEALAVPAGDEGVYGVTFERMEIKGQTGRYQGATATLRLFGGVDLGSGETVFRYRGQLCFAPGRP